MDEECIESSEPIFELASECEKLFSEKISRLKDEADLNGTKVVGEYQQRFSAWAAFLGVFAVPEMCLDRRLQRHAEVQDLVLRLIDIMKRNLTHLFESENASDGEKSEAPSTDEDSSPQSQLHISIESLRGIEGAIERLHHLGGTIQLSSEASQATKFGKFAAKFDSASFEEVARLAIRSFYPDASPSLIEHLARTMTDMYQKFHYRRSRQVRLQARPQPQLQLPTINEEPAPQIKVDTWKDDPPPPPPPPINDIYKRLARPVVMSHLGARSHQSRDSKPTSLDSQEFKKLFPQRKDGSVKSKTRSIAANLVAYPQPSEASLVCDWCFSPLPEDEFKAEKWKKHLNEDFKPYLCLSEKCSEPLKRFATSTAWFSHMLEAHGQNWHREVHLPTWWICPLCNNQETTYPKAQDLSEHISKLHRDVFTEQQIQVIVHQSRLRAPRPQDVCPLCCLSMKDEQEKDENDQVLKKAFPKLSVQDDKLAESYKRIKTETGSMQLDQQNDVNAEPTEQATPNPQVPAFQGQSPLNIEFIARHVAAHLQGIMLFSLRMMALDAVADKSADDRNLSGNTDDDLSRLGSNQQHSLPETQEMDDITPPPAQDESMDVDYPLLEDTIPDCEHDMNWQEFIPNSEPLPESDTFLQQVIDSGAFQTKEQSPTRGAAIKTALHKKPVIVRPRTPSVTIIIFPFRHDPDFIGHQAILNDLVSECSKPPARLALVGIGGIGKTQLAIELAYRLVKLAKMSVFWINAESRLSIEEGFKSIAWNAASWRQETDAGWLRVSYDWLSNERNGRWVLILDGANEESISHIEASLPKSQNGAIIVTTRLRDVAYRLTGGSQDVIEVGPLSVHGAVTLLEKKLGRTATERFSKFGDTSGLVKSLGLIPLAICRAAAYIQHLSPKLPIKDNDYATGNPLVDDKQYTGDRFPFGPTKSSLNKPLNVLSPKISPPDDFRPRTEELDEENSLDDTFMYEDDEDDNINDYGYGNKSKDRADNRTEYFNDFGGPGFDETLREKEEEKKALLQVEKQLAQLRDNEQEKIKLLEFEVFSSDRSGQTLRSLFGTWKSSFDAIHSKRPSAIDLLSLMSFFDRRGIPKWLLRPSKRGDGAQQSDVPPIEGDMNDEIDASLNDDMDMLINHCLITANSTEQVFSMHGLVQLSVKNNMDPFLLQAFEQQFIKRLAMAFPRNISSNWATCEELSAHVQLAVDCHPSDHLLEDWASLLHNWGRFSRLLGRYEIAMQTADQVLIAREKIGMDNAKILTLIALIHMDRGVYDRAEELFSRVADIYNRSLRLNDTQAWISMNNLASMYKVKGQWKEAEEIHIQVGIRRVDHFGHDHPRTLASRANLASTYRAQGRYFQAERLQKEVVEGYKNKLGLDHHLTLTSMSNLGSIYRLQGKLLEAESLQVQAMESLKIKFGVEHADTLTSMNSLASTYRARGLFDKAEALQEQVMEIRKAIFGSDHPSTLASMNNLALTCSAQGNHNRAAKLQSQVVEVCKAKLGPEHPHTLTSLNNIALIWKGQGRDADGRWKMDECVEARLRILGQNHPYTIASMKAADKWWDPV